MQAVGHFSLHRKVSWEAKTLQEGIMTTEWSLDELYKGFDDPAYGKDVAELTAQIDALATLLADAGRMQEKERTEKVLAAQSRDRTAFSISYRSMWN